MLKFWYAYDPAIGTLEAWFNMILRNSIYSTLLFYKRQGMSLEEKHSGVYEVDFEGEITRDELRAAIFKENAKHRTVLICQYIHGMNIADIVKLVGMNRENVKKILYRFKLKVKRRYE